MALGDYVRFNVYEDVVTSLELVAHLAPFLSKQSQHWKWMIVGAHSALQGAMVCGLFDRNAVLKKRNRKNKKAAQQAAALGVPQAWVEGRLEDFLVLFRRCIKGNSFCEALALKPKQRDAIRKLHREYRNNFAHFVPHQGWSLLKVELPPMIGAALAATEMLMHRDYVVGQMDDDQQRRLTEALATARKHLPIA